MLRVICYSPYPRSARSGQSSGLHGRAHHRPRHPRGSPRRPDGRRRSRHRTVRRQHGLRDERTREEHPVFPLRRRSRVSKETAVERHPLPGAVGEPSQWARLLGQRQAVRPRYEPGQREHGRNESHPRTVDQLGVLAGGQRGGGQAIRPRHQPPGVLAIPGIDGPVALCARIRDDLHAQGWDARSARKHHQPEQRSDAGGDRVSSLLPHPRCPTRSVDRSHPGTPARGRR